ncbi:transfer RNA nucleotidyltransferase [Ephemerocybe angulata]|uniref:Transfer RNA nucleotidyltransferase n=1 Tax=Ephemerocybe angulata TaxID=980116 RepID=A0A8H6MGZ0_9AGAR|nr:transfer RNA nucleotidyltransferase [Tulosesus angulatus]
MMGQTFAKHLSEYAQDKGIEVGKITEIPQNPEQSKHLETATLTLCGLSIDLVNLRSEEYAENSRIPTGVAFGTPLEDAKRRDITINALFYNVHNKQVEDFTEQGLDDLRDGVIRTPLPPLETFKDDPLRVLRCIRFASRLGYTLVSELTDAAQDPAIQDALVSKISRERVGVEVDKMMQGRDPLRSIELFHELNLFDAIFFSAIPENVSASFSTKKFDPDRGLASSVVLNSITEGIHAEIPTPHPIYLKHLQIDRSARPRLFLASALTPYYGASFKDKKGKEHPGVEAVVRESLKLGVQNHYLDGIPALFMSVEPVRQLLGEYLTFPAEKVRSSIGAWPPAPKTRLLIFVGLALRNKVIHSPNAGIHWSESALFSMITELGALYNVSGDSFQLEKASAVLAKYNRLAEQIADLDLYDVGEAVPLLNGKEIMKAMNKTRGGPWLSVVQLHIMQWQLDNPTASAEDCRVWLEEERVAGRLPQATSPEPPSKKVRVK